MTTITAILTSAWKIIKSAFYKAAFLTNETHQIKEEKIMKILSEEKLKQLQDELRLVNMTLGILRERSHVYAKEHGFNPVTAAMTSLTNKKVELEAQIEALAEFLHS